MSQRKTRVGVVSWSDEAIVDFHLNEFELKQDVLTVKQVPHKIQEHLKQCLYLFSYIQAISFVKYIGGRTNTVSALRRIRQEMLTSAAGDRPDVTNYLYVITDGNSNIEPEETVREATRLRREGTYIVTVSVG